MFGRQDITVDSHPPALVSPNFNIAVHTINEGRQLGAEEENVDAAILGEAVEGVGD